MQIYNDVKKRVGVLEGFLNRSVTKTLSTGDRELSFEYPANGDKVSLLKEEYYIRTKTDEYVIKAVEKMGKVNRYTAALNVEELEGEGFPYGFASKEQTIRACLEFAFEGTGWKIGTCTITKRRTIDIEDSTTAWGVLQQVLKTYRGECAINSLEKRIDIYEQIGQDRGCYFMEGLNLRKLTMKSDTYDFYTRIYPIGKDGIEITWLHGKPYLENYQFSKKVKTYVWKDERYTNTTSLIEDAAAKLEEMSKPYQAYTADVLDLAKASEEFKDVLNYSIGDTMTLVSKRTGVKEKQRIVKIVEYDESEKNTAELSNARKTFAQIQQEETEVAKQEAINIANKSTKKMLEDYSTAEEIETKIAASKENIEISVMHTLESYYDKTETDAQIGLAKGEIKLEASRIYQTKEEMGDYYTQSETRSLIDLTSEEISMEVSKKVGSEEIISKINQSPEKVAIKANMINFNGLVTANEKFKILQDGSMEAKDGKFKGSIESNSAKITGGSLKVGAGCELTSAGVLYAVSPKMLTGIQLGKNMGVGFESQSYGMAMFYVGNQFQVGSSDTGNVWMPRICPLGVTSYGDGFFTGDLGCTGTKSRYVETEEFGTKKEYCYEMASPMFGDMGSGKIDASGTCYIFVDQQFSQTIDTGSEYFVFLTKAGEGDLYIDELQNDYFVVKGTPGIHFFWEMKARQKNYTGDRLETILLDVENPEKEEDQIMINEMMESRARVEEELIYDELELNGGTYQ